MWKAVRSLTLVSLVFGGCQSTGKAPPPLPPSAASTETDLDGAKSEANRILSEAKTQPERRDVAQKSAEKALAEGRGLDAALILTALYRTEGGALEREALQEQLLDLVDTSLSGVELRTLLEDLPDEDQMREHLLFKVALLQRHTERTQSSELFQDYLAQYPNGSYAERAQAVLRNLETLQTVRATAVGVLLPLSGPKGGYGVLARKALELAFEGSAVELIVLDTEDDAVTAARATEQLVKEGVIAILGLLFPTESRASAAAAERLGVPLLTMSRDATVISYGPWIFRNGVTQKAQVDALLEYATETLGFSKFAILHPRHPYGEGLRDLFWQAVKDRGGTVMGIESYELDATTFAEPVKKLVGRFEPARRADYVQAVKDCSVERDAYRQKRCRDQVLKTLPPFIDFDALFIPDFADRIQMIAAALAAEDIIVEQDEGRLRVISKTLGRTPKVVTLLGSNGWNSPKLTQSTGRTVENAIFTDWFFERAGDEKVARFVQKYRERYGRPPRLNPEALTYDCGRIVRMVVEHTSPQTREEFRQALLAVRDYPGVTGMTSFGGRTDAQKDLMLLTVKEGQVQELGQPPEAGSSDGAQMP